MQQILEAILSGTATAEDKKRTRASWSTLDVVTSAIVLACISGAYLYFRG